MAEKLPEYQRTTGFDATTAMPNWGDELRAFAANTNTMGAIGAQVAQSASTQIAIKRGYEMGQNPQGDLLPPITQFDKTLTESYHAQSQAVLSLQGQKLLIDADNAMSSASRLTPAMIQNTTQQVGIGLEKIAQNAPTAIKGNLEATFTSQLLNQRHQYQNKMIGQQKEDQKNTLIASMSNDANVSYELSVSGDTKGAQDRVKNTEMSAKSAVDNRLITPEAARTAIETTRQAAINGEAINKMMEAKADGKEAKYMADFANAKPATLGLTQKQKESATVAMIQHKNTIDTMTRQQEQLTVGDFKIRLAKNPMAVTANELQEVKDSVSPAMAQQVEIDYIQAVKAFKKSQAKTNLLLSNFSDPTVFANSSNDDINSAFNANVENLKTKKGLSTQDAEVLVAATAGGKVPVFVDTLQNKLSSANPAMIEEAGQQVHLLTQIGAGRVVSQLNDNAKIMAAKYESLRDSLDPVTAAREATNAVYNQTPEMIRANKERWSAHLSTMTKDVPQADFALSLVGHKQDDFLNRTTANMYAANILEKYSTYYQLSNGDAGVATKLTKQFVDENYGFTGVNGSSNMTLHPLEKVLGYKSSDVVPYIHEDISNQMSKSFMATKEAYLKGESNEYWEVLPVDKKNHGWINDDYAPLKVVRHMKVGNKVVDDKFDVVIQGNAFDNWDVAVNSPTGMRNLFQIAPYLGVVSYIPNKKAIDASYIKDHQIKQG